MAKSKLLNQMERNFKAPFEDFVYILCIGAIIMFYLYFLFPANLDLISSSNELFMDEQISFDEVHRILNSHSIKEFFRNIILGDQRYGRIIYVVYSIFSFFTFNIFGEPGLIVTNRFLGFVFIIIANLLLIKTFIKNEILSVLTFIALLSIPSTAYYSTMPKPEPLLILLLSLFVFFYVKKSFQFGVHFIFLGLAFGCKVSLLITVAFIFLFSTFLMVFNTQIKLDLKYLIKTVGYSLLYFLIGLIIAVPILFLTVVNIVFFKDYIYSTILNSGHGEDDIKVNIFSWIVNISDEWFLAPSSLSFIVLILSTVIIFIAFKSTSTFSISCLTILNLFILASSLIFPIILLVKRLWYFYLHTGFVFYILLIFHCVSIVIKISKIKKYLSVLLFFTLITTTFLIAFLFKGQITYLVSQSRRTQETEYLLQNERCKYLNSFLTGNINKQRLLKVYYSPQLFRLSNRTIDVKYIYGFFNSWEDGRDFIVLSDSNNPTINKPIVTNAEYKDWSKAITNYNNFVNLRNQKFHYEKIAVPFKGVYLFKKIL